MKRLHERLSVNDGAGYGMFAKFTGISRPADQNWMNRPADRPQKFYQPIKCSITDDATLVAGLEFHTNDSNFGVLYQKRFPVFPFFLENRVQM